MILLFKSFEKHSNNIKHLQIYATKAFTWLSCGFRKNVCQTFLKRLLMHMRDVHHLLNSNLVSLSRHSTRLNESFYLHLFQKALIFLLSFNIISNNFRDNSINLIKQTLCKLQVGDLRLLLSFPRLSYIQFYGSWKVLFYSPKQQLFCLSAPSLLSSGVGILLLKYALCHLSLSIIIFLNVFVSIFLSSLFKAFSLLLFRLFPFLPPHLLLIVFYLSASYTSTYAHEIQVYMFFTMYIPELIICNFTLQT